MSHTPHNRDAPEVGPPSSPAGSPVASAAASNTPPGPDMRLPIDDVVDQVAQALTGGVAVLEAPAGAGKTTRLPLALLEGGIEGRMVVLEPRRVAARAAARRLAAQLDEPVGKRIGLTTRDDKLTSAHCQIEVVTEGVLLNRLQHDPALESIGMLFFDEFHERNLEADLALAFALESRAALREDLQLLVASATLDGDRVSKMLGGAPVVRAQGRMYDVEISHRERPANLEAGVRDAVLDLLASGRDGDILVFLPGVREIHAAQRVLDNLTDEVAVLPLHGMLPAAEQDAAIAPSAHRKVVLATDLAESSITIDGVTAVVDAGLSREPRFDPATAMTGLTTLSASRASADQRAGRAGRTAPGRAIRLWPAREHGARDAFPRPAIHTDDLTSAALEVAAWGTEVAGLALLDQPHAPTWQRARQTLTDLGALGADGKITEHGRALARLPVHPRIGHLLLTGRDRGLGSLAVEVAALLADRDIFIPSREAPDADLAARVAVLRGARPPATASVHKHRLKRARSERDRLARLLHVSVSRSRDVDLDRVGELVLTSWPDRLAARRGHKRGSFLLANGRGAELSDIDVLANEPLLAVAHLDRGRTSARIHLAAAVDHDQVRERLPVAIETTVQWRDGDVRADRREQLGAITVSTSQITDPDPTAVHEALVAGLAEEGLGLLGASREAHELRARAAMIAPLFGDWPDLSDQGLIEAAFPFLLGARKRKDLAQIQLIDVIRTQLGHSRSRQLDKLAPSHLDVPSGSRIRLDYDQADKPVLPVRLQEMFGATTTPTIAAGRLPVLIHLLSPAGRPVQVTEDLAGFWERIYPQVRAELRGRYPKHAWPEDPLSAAPLRGTKRRN